MPNKILVVDDDGAIRYLLALLLESRGHEVIEAENGEQGLRRALSEHPSLVITDVMMPVMDGFEFCRRLRSEDPVRDVPVLFYSATYTRQDERGFALANGANGYLQKPAEAARLIQAVESLLAGQSAPAAVQPESEFWTQHRAIVLRKLEDKVEELAEANAQLQRRDQSLRQAMTAMVETISRMLEHRDPYTAGHQKRVGLVAAAIGREMGLPESQVEGLLYGGYVHDIGKIAAPVEILTRPGRLSDIEQQIIRVHPEAGYDILHGIDFPWPVALMALQHHERIDGSGYPHGLKGDEILLESRILAVADTIEAIGSDRPYRPAVGIDTALDEVESGAGTRYDPEVSAICLRMFREKGFQLPQ